MIREKALTQKLIRRNVILTLTVLLLVIGVIVGSRACLSIIEKTAIKPGQFTLVYMVFVLMLLLSVGVVWGLRGLQRQDIYAMARGYTRMQLKRFISELQDEYDRMQAEEKTDKEPEHPNSVKIS